jgi:hypothetical protein
MKRNALLFAGLLALSSLVVDPVSASSLRIGVAAAVSNHVTGTLVGATSSQPIRQGSKVFRNEMIETAEKSTTQLIFVDETSLTVGPKSQVRLDSFVYDPKSRNGKIVVNALKGAFRFVSGSARKTAYRIKTPLATIGVRGTIIDGFVDAVKNLVLLILQEGAMEVCSATGCKDVTRAGSFVIIRADGGISDPKEWDGSYRSLPAGTPFPLFGHRYGSDDLPVFPNIGVRTRDLKNAIDENIVPDTPHSSGNDYVPPSYVYPDYPSASESD